MAIGPGTHVTYNYPQGIVDVPAVETTTAWTTAVLDYNIDPPGWRTFQGHPIEGGMAYGIGNTPKQKQPKQDPHEYDIDAD